MKRSANNRIVHSSLALLIAFLLASCATINTPHSDITFESLRAFEIAFVDEFAVPGKKFDAAAFDAKVAEGNAKFQDAMNNEKFKARRPVLQDLSNQFKAEAAHLRKKASTGKVTPALATEMKRDKRRFRNILSAKRQKARRATRPRKQRQIGPGRFQFLRRESKTRRANFHR